MIETRHKQAFLTDLQIVLIIKIVAHFGEEIMVVVICDEPECNNHKWSNK